MHGNVTNEEWQIFKEAYQYFSDHCLPPFRITACRLLIRMRTLWTGGCLRLRMSVSWIRNGKTIR